MISVDFRGFSFPNCNNQSSNTKVSFGAKLPQIKAATELALSKASISTEVAVLLLRMIKNIEEIQSVISKPAEINLMGTNFFPKSKFSKKGQELLTAFDDRLKQYYTNHSVKLSHPKSMGKFIAEHFDYLLNLDKPYVLELEPKRPANGLSETISRFFHKD